MNNKSPDSLHILLIDDEPDDRLLVSRSLEKEFNNLKITQVIDHDSLEHALNQGDFDLVITDYQLHWSDGLKVLQSIKSMYPLLPVVMFTNTGTEEVAVQGMKQGLDDYVLKSPKHYKLLPPVVNACLSKHKELKARYAAEKALKESEARYRGLIETAPDAIVTVDNEGRIVMLNKQTEKMFGYTRDRLYGQSMEMLVPESFRNSHVTHRKKYYKEPTTRPMGKCIGLYGLTSDGRKIPIEVGLSPLHTEQGMLTTAIVRDISDRLKMEEELRRAKEKLEEKVQLRTRELEQANIHLGEMIKKAENFSQAKSEFLATMSHELRTPLNAIIGYSELLQEEMADTGEQSHHSDLDKIISAGKHLLSMINGILDMSKIEAGKHELSLETFNVQEVSRELTTTLRFVVEQNNNKLEYQCDASITNATLDITKVRQILFNLLSNAAKFTSNGEIEFLVKRHEHDGEKGIEFIVSDNGIGMDSEQLKRIFNPFVQADGNNTARRYGGTGLGLAISKHFCEMMEGHLHAESNPGEGSRFTVWLPEHLNNEAI